MNIGKNARVYTQICNEERLINENREQLETINKAYEEWVAPEDGPGLCEGGIRKKFMSERKRVLGSLSSREGNDLKAICANKVIVSNIYIFVMFLLQKQLD